MSDLRINIKDLRIYIKEVVSHMISKVWFIRGVVSFLVFLALWLLPQPIVDSIKTESNLATWWIANGKWVGLGIFGFVTVFLAPFLAWRTEFHGKEAESHRRAEIEKQLQEEKTKNNRRFIDHCEDLGKAAFELAEGIDHLLDLKNWSSATFKGNLIDGVQVNRSGEIEWVKVHYTFGMRYLEKHLQVDEKYPLVNVKLTSDVVTRDLYERLNTLANSRAFDLVSACPICKEIMK
jgi:hypothetical protein